MAVNGQQNLPNSGSYRHVFRFGQQEPVRDAFYPVDTRRLLSMKSFLIARHYAEQDDLAVQDIHVHTALHNARCNRES